MLILKSFFQILLSILFFFCIITCKEKSRRSPTTSVEHVGGYSQEGGAFTTHPHTVCLSSLYCGQSKKIISANTRKYSQTNTHTKYNQTFIQTLNFFQTQRKHLKKAYHTNNGIFYLFGDDF